MSGAVLGAVPLLACALSGSAIEAAAERMGTIVGTVVDDSSGAPLYGGNVAAGRTKMGAHVDRDGRFTLDVPAGIRLVHAMQVRYCRMYKVVSVAPGETVSVNFALRRVRVLIEDGDFIFAAPCTEPETRFEPLPSPDGKPWVVGTVIDRNTGQRVRSPHLTIDGAEVDASGGWFAAPVDTAVAEVKVSAIGYEGVARRLELRACCVDTTHFRLLPVEK